MAEDRVCWCCGRGPEAHDSKYVCLDCVAHGASRFPVPEGVTWTQSEAPKEENE